MVSLEEEVKKLFKDKPELLKGNYDGAMDGAIEILREMKDPKTNRTRWRVPTIRNRVDVFLKGLGIKKSSGEILSGEGDASKKPAVEIEEAGIGRHPTDPFAAKDGKQIVPKDADVWKNVTQSVGSNSEVLAKISEENTAFRKEMLAKISEDDKKSIAFRAELIGIVTGLKEGLVTAVEEVKRDVSSRIESLPKLAADEEKYDEIMLKQPVIDLIKEGVVEGNLAEDSEFIENLITDKKELEEEVKPYRALIEVLVKAGGKIPLLMSYYDDKMGYKQLSGRLGVNLKSLILGVAIGAGVLGLIWFLVSFFAPVVTPVIP